MKFKQIGALLSISTILGINVFATKALAQVPSITFGNAIASGGCDVVGQLRGPDGRTLSIILDNMSASHGQRQRCILRVDTTIPPGFLVQDVDVLYQGSTDVMRRSRGITFSRSYTLTGGQLGIATSTPQITQFRVSNPLFQVQDALTVLSLSNSCRGTRGQFGINMVAQSSIGSSIVVDSADLNAGDVRLHFNLIPC